MVVLHWLTVILIFGAGFLSDGEGSSFINPHMILGGLLLVTLIVRVIVRFTTKRPAWASTGNPFLNKLGELVHIGLYIAAFSILALGGVIAYQRNIIGSLLGSGDVLRIRLGIVGALHHLGWIAVVGLLLLHIGGALYHQIILKDNLFDRMSLRK